MSAYFHFTVILITKKVYIHFHAKLILTGKEITSMSQYAVLKFNKIKAGSTTKSASLRRCFEHNHRTYIPDNADPDKQHENQTLVAMESKNYYQEFKKTVNQAIKNKTMNKVRSNAVLGIEALMTYTNNNDNSIDVQKWSMDSIEWLKRIFGEDNVKDVVLHMDEATPHIHAFIVPMYEGRLNCKHYLDGPEKLRQMQSDYAKTVGLKYNLKRGISKKNRIKNTVDYKTIKSFREATIGRETVSVEDVEPKENELDDDGNIQPEYVTRVRKAVEDNNFRHLAERNKLKEQYDQSIDELASERDMLLKENKRLKRRIKKLENDVDKDAKEAGR